MKNKTLQLPRTDLSAYAAALWPPFEMARHHRTLIDALERVESGIFDRVMILMPPRHGKSLITSTLFPAWYLGRHPDKSIIASSYGQELASDLGRRVRGFVSDPLHRAIFPDCAISDDSDSVHRFHLTQGGAYFAVGAGGALTGRGADLLLIDDPIKGREDADSAAVRRSLQSWYESTAYTRLQPGGAVIIIATRWHESDLVGWLLKEHAGEGWKVISMPALAETNESWRKEGDPLWPEKFPLDTLIRIKGAIGSSAWASLYQQRPAPEEGNIFHRDWWRRYSEAPAQHQRLIFSLDCAYKTGKANDYSVILVMAETKTGYYILHISRGRWEFPELKRQAIALADIWKPNSVVIEDAASGQSLVQSLKAETRLPILPVKASGDKQSRAHAISPLVESGKVSLPESASWLTDFLDEATAFPASAHDDQVDALSQALNYLHGAGRGWQPSDGGYVSVQRSVWAPKTDRMICPSACVSLGSDGQAAGASAVFAGNAVRR
jgi:predicted phage terminase large subunit-like protein